MSRRDIAFAVHNRQLAGRRWQRGARYPALALHGWRDNCASFDLLAPRLADSDLVAIDLAGHAHSDFRSADGSYNIWADVGELLTVADQLGWDSFDLIGHSRGAAVATLLAASHPRRVRRLALIDGLFPLPVDIHTAPQQLAQAIADNRRLAGRPPRYYSSFEQAMAPRLRGPLRLGERAARLLAERGLTRDHNGWYWRLDPRLGGASDVKFSAAHGEAFVAAIACPALLLLGQQSPFGQLPYIRELAALNPQIAWHEVAGGHHCHMEEGVEGIAELINALVTAPDS